MKDIEINLLDERTEEVQNIIERMPTKFGRYVTMIILFIFTLFFLFGFIVKYPDVVVGQITISPNSGPIKLVSNSSGKLKLLKTHSLDEVKEGQVMGYLENSTTPKTVYLIDSILKLYTPNGDEILKIENLLPANLSIGELNLKYYSFVNNLQQYKNYRTNKIYDVQGKNLSETLMEQRNAVAAASNRLDMAKVNLGYSQKFYKRDSLLFTKRVISESELDKSQMYYLSTKDAYQNSSNNLITARQMAQQTAGKLEELSIQKPEREKELRINLISSYNELIDNIKSWGLKYVFRAPVKGRVQFMKFYSEDQFIQNGEQVFTVIPKQDKALGHVFLPVSGSGKLRSGEKAIIKLDNFPYLEYGSIMGEVKSMSLVSSTIRGEKSDIESYMVLIAFPENFITNYGKKLDLKAEARGTAEIITNDRRLIMRLFDNLKYVLNK